MNKLTCYWKKFRNTIFYKLVADTARGFENDNPMLLGASIAFYMIFSMPAILIFMVFIAERFYGEQAVEGRLYEYIVEFVGTDSAKQIQNILRNARFDESGFFTRVIAVITLMFSATTVFANVQYSLNAIWGVRAKPDKGWLKFLIDRLFSFVIVAILGVLLLTAVLANFLLENLESFISQFLPDYTVYLMQGLSFALVVTVVTVVFALVFKLLPDAKVRWRDVWVGSLVTSMLFIMGKELIGIYLNQSDTTSTYGAAGSLVFLLIWIYYSTVIFLIGAEFTKAYSERVGKEIRPKKNAVRVIRKEIEREVKEKETA